jgi:hypothetical protein
MSQTCLRYLPVVTRSDALLASAEYLSLALADVRGDHEAWARSLAEAFGRVELRLRAHRKEARAPHGPLSAVDDTRPTLARRADKLLREQSVLVGQALSLKLEARLVADSLAVAKTKQRRSSNSRERASVRGEPDVQGIHHRAEQFLASLEKQRGAETTVVQESVNTDIGVGD